MSDVEVLRQFALSPDPAMFSTELTDPLDMTQQGVYERLMSLTEKGYLDTKKVGKCRAWWLTPEGRQHIAESDS